MKVKIRVMPAQVPRTSGQLIPHIPTAYEQALKVILQRDGRSGPHARSVAHAVGVWPA